MEYRVHSARDVQNVLKGKIPGTIKTDQGFVAGETLPVTVRTAAGQIIELNVVLNNFPSADLTAYLIIPSILGFFFLIISLWIFGMRRTEQGGRSLALFASSLALVTGALFDLYTTHTLTYVWTLAIAVAGGAIFDLALSFPQEARLVVGRPYLRWIGMLISIGLTVYAYTTLFNFERPTDYILAWRYIYLFVAAQCSSFWA